MRATGAEAALAGRTASEGVLEAAGREAAEECDPSPDLRGSVEYKRDLTRVLVKRAVAKAVTRVSLARLLPPTPLRGDGRDPKGGTA